MAENASVARGYELKKKRTVRKTHSKDLLTQKNSGLTSLLKEFGNSGTGLSQLKTFKMETSSVLSRVKCFLPEMEAADRVLKQRLAEESSRLELDVEHVAEGKPCIEMDMAVLPMEGLYSSDDLSDDDMTLVPAPPPVVHKKLLDRVVSSVNCEEESEDDLFAVRLPEKTSNKKCLVVEVS